MTHFSQYWGAYQFPGTPPRPDLPQPKPPDPDDDDDDDARKAENRAFARVAGLCGPHGSPLRCRMTRSELLQAEALVFFVRDPQPKKENPDE